MLIPVQADNSLASCSAACEAGSPYCLVAELPNNEASGLKALYSKLEGTPAAISAAELQAQFGLPNDPCHREGTTIENGVLTNGGETCTLQSTIASVGLTAFLDIPAKLKGNFRSSGNEVQLDISDPDYRPRLRFDPQYFSDEWGGEISHVAGRSDRLLFSVGTNSCIRFDFP